MSSINHYVVDCNSLRRNDKIRSEVDVFVVLEKDYDLRDSEAHAAQSELSALREELAECITEMTLAITDHETRRAMTVVGRTRFMEIIRKYNAKQPTESGASE